MTTPQPPSARAGVSRPAAFTLVELLIVMLIIAILAGLTLGTFGFAQNKAARSKTSAQLKAIEMGLEQYYTEYGEYPSPTGSGAPSDTSTGGFDGTGAAALYQVLSGDGTDAILTDGYASDGIVSTGTPPPEEFPIFDNIHGDDKFGQVDTDGTTYWLVDGFGNPWQYATPGSVAGGVNEGGGTGANAGEIVNQTYDLWSVADDDLLDSVPAKWITNW